MSIWIPVIAGAIPTILGIIATIIAWKYNPKNRIDAELDSIAKQKKGLYAIQDIAYAKKDTDTITIVNATLNELRDRENTLLLRRPKN